MLRKYCSNMDFIVLFLGRFYSIVSGQSFIFPQDFLPTVPCGRDYVVMQENEYACKRIRKHIMGRVGRALSIPLHSKMDDVSDIKFVLQIS